MLVPTSSAQQQPPDAPSMDERAAARYFSISRETLRAWRRSGRGPRCYKLGGKLVRYALADLAAWQQEQVAMPRAQGEGWGKSSGRTGSKTVRQSNSLK
jgi:predicted DNA-binding transcriptional regulator AlpA